MGIARNNQDSSSQALIPFGSEYLLPLALDLINFSKRSFSPQQGFGYLDAHGQVDVSKPRQTYVQCRMIQVLGLAELIGFSSSKSIIESGLDTLLDEFRDKKNGGFYNSIDSQGNPLSDTKLAYDHAFVLLAASTAIALELPRASELFKEIDLIIDKYFWDEDFQMMKNSWNLDFTSPDEYRGINANMHAVEAFAAAYDVTGDIKYANRAYAICERAINRFARESDWFLPEHFDSHWSVDKEFNVDIPADPFCPYGVTIGHLLEWSRLILHLKLQVAHLGKDVTWIDDAAKNLYRVAKSLGWAPDGGDGFVYTIDWNGHPVVQSRMHWVVAEAVMTAFTLWDDTKNPEYLEDYKQWWKYIDKNVLDKEYGSWHHELSVDQKVVAGTWSGKPDTYHAFNAAILPMFPLNSSFIQTAIAAKKNRLIT